MSVQTKWPRPGPIYVVRWTRIGGSRVHRFYFKRHYAEKFATALADLDYDVELHGSNTLWSRLDLPDHDTW